MCLCAVLSLWLDADNALAALRSSGPDCRRAGNSVASSTDLRLGTMVTAGAGNQREPGTIKFFACDAPHRGVAVFDAPDGLGPWLGSQAGYVPRGTPIAGHLFAYVTYTIAPEGAQSAFGTSLDVMRISAGGQVTEVNYVSIAFDDPYLTPFDDGVVADVAVAPNGAVGWIACTATVGYPLEITQTGHVRGDARGPRCRPGAPHFVYTQLATAAVQGTRPQLVSSGTGIKLGSLRVVGNNFSWQNGQTNQTALL